MSSFLPMLAQWLWARTSRVGILLLSLLALGGILLMAREPLLRATGGWLDATDPYRPCQALFVLAGAPLERADGAAALMKKGAAPRVVCTGELVPGLFQYLRMDYPEALIDRNVLIAMGVDSAAIDTVRTGTSTIEECRAIRDYCRQRQLTKIMVLTTTYHTRRTRWTLNRVFRGTGIEVVLQGAGSWNFKEAEWWQSEEGLIFVNNEYVKLAFYWLKY